MEIGQQPMMQSQENKILNKSSTLIISVSLQELNIYLLSSTDNELKKSLNTQFSGNNSTDILLDNLKKSLLDFDIKNVLDVKLIVNNKLSVLVPDEIFNKKLSIEYLKFNSEIFSNDTSEVDDLSELNAKNVYFKGNIKLYDPINEIGIENFNKDFLIKKRFWFAASTHKGEDLFCLKTHIKLKKKFDGIITIIAPRHVERSKEIKSLSEKLRLRAQILDENQSILDNKEIIIVNYFGALKTYFKYAKSVFIGKSMLPKLKHVGGQNPIEAAKLECKIYHGPYVYNFEDIYKILESNNISKRIESFEELSENLLFDLKNPQKQNNENKNLINDLGKKTLTDTMVLIDAFLND